MGLSHLRAARLLIPANGAALNRGFSMIFHDSFSRIAVPANAGAQKRSTGAAAELRTLHARLHRTTDGTRLMGQACPWQLRRLLSLPPIHSSEGCSAVGQLRSLSLCTVTPPCPATRNGTS